MFKESYKYYKAKNITPDFTEVLNFDNNNEKTQQPNAACEFKLSCDVQALTSCLPHGMQQLSHWRCYTLPSHPGLLVVRNPFTTQGQRYWIARCLRDFPRQPNVVNLHPRLFAPEVIEDWWMALQKCTDKEECRRMRIAMRWATLGYHHDWDTKVYSESMRNEFPPDLDHLCRYFATVLGFASFQPQAAIVNYYPIGTTLAGHTDHSELNLEAPLFSLSFGQTAIFLIGGPTREQRPTALFLHSGDVLVMSDEARLCYHAVPRVMKATEEPWNESISLVRSPVIQQQQKKQRIERESETSEAGIDMLLYDRVADEAYWAPYSEYLNGARLNVNVRQVLPLGIDKLAGS